MSSNSDRKVEEAFPDQYEDALMYQEYFQDNSVIGGDFEYRGESLHLSDILEEPTLEQIAIILKRYPSIAEGMDEDAACRKLARALADNYPHLVKQTEEAQVFFEKKAPKSRKTVQSRTKKTGCRSVGGWLILIVIALGVWIAVRSKPEKTAEVPAAPPQEPSQLTTSQLPTTKAAVEPKAARSESQSQSHDSIKEETFESASFPITIITTQSITLFNESGKETQIPPNTKIKILGRKKLGTLTMHISGALYVGHEESVIGKFKLAE